MIKLDTSNEDFNGEGLEGLADEEEEEVGGGKAAGAVTGGVAATSEFCLEEGGEEAGELGLSKEELG